MCKKTDVWKSLKLQLLRIVALVYFHKYSFLYCQKSSDWSQSQASRSSLHSFSFEFQSSWWIWIWWLQGRICNEYMNTISNWFFLCWITCFFISREHACQYKSHFRHLYIQRKYMFIYMENKCTVICFYCLCSNQNIISKGSKNNTRDSNHIIS